MMKARSYALLLLIPALALPLWWMLGDSTPEGDLPGVGTEAASQDPNAPGSRIQSQSARRVACTVPSSHDIGQVKSLIQLLDLLVDSRDLFVRFPFLLFEGLKPAQAHRDPVLLGDVGVS